MFDWVLNIVLAKMSNFKFKMMPKIESGNIISETLRTLSDIYD